MLFHDFDREIKTRCRWSSGHRDYDVLIYSDFGILADLIRLLERAR